MNLMSFLLALIPILWLIVALGILKMPGHKVCPSALILTIIIAIISFKMPIISALSATLEGALTAIWPIIIVIIAAVFTYNLSVYTKSMEKIKKMLATVTTDNRILVLILAWGFGGFLEAVAGFGTAVAIPASIMAALDFDPIFAAIICLIANTTPTAFGAIGLPVTTLAKVANINVQHLTYAVAIQLFALIIIVPFILVMITGKSIKAVKGVTLITLVSGLGFGIPQLLSAMYLGAELPAIIGSIISMALTIVVAKVFYKNTSAKNNEVKFTFKEIIIAWMPFILVFLFVMFTSSLFPFLNKPLSKISTSVTIYNGKGATADTFTWIATPGVLIIIATFIGGFIQGAKFGEIMKVLIETIKQMSKTAVTIISIIALAKVMSYSGMISSIATVLVALTGSFYPIIAPLIGALGTFVTGSDTSANVLFGPLQVEVANKLSMNPYWLAASSTCGATAGKMISPQSIAVATAATGLAGSEGKILGSTIKFCIVYVIVLGLISYFGAPLMNLL